MKTGSKATVSGTNRLASMSATLGKLPFQNFQPICEASKLLGINASLVYRYQAEAHRTLEKFAKVTS